MKNIKKFNEHSYEDYIDAGELPAGYTPKTGRSAKPAQLVPITMEYVKDSIIEVMKDYNDEVDVNDPKFAEAINSLAKKIMGNFQDPTKHALFLQTHFQDVLGNLHQRGGEYEDDIDNILSLDDNLFR